MTREDAKPMEEYLNEEEHHVYRQIVGKVQYLCNERDDLLYSTKECAKDLNKPTK